MEKEFETELVEDTDFEEFEEDFDAKPAQYEVWLLGYDADQNITDHSCLLNQYSDPDPAVKFAQEVSLDVDKYIPDEMQKAVTYVEVIVETVVKVDDIDTNVGTLFSEILKIK